MRKLTRFTQDLAILREERFWAETEQDEAAHIVWHGVELERPDLGVDSHSLAFELHHPEGGEHLHVILNAYWEPLSFALPPLPAGGGWHRIVDTALDSPDDFCEPETAPGVVQDRYEVGARSAVILMRLADKDHARHHL